MGIKKKPLDALLWSAVLWQPQGSTYDSHKYIGDSIRDTSDRLLEYTEIGQYFTKIGQYFTKIGQYFTKIGQ